MGQREEGGCQCVLMVVVDEGFGAPKRGMCCRSHQVRSRSVETRTPLLLRREAQVVREERRRHVAPRQRNIPSNGVTQQATAASPQANLKVHKDERYGAIVYVHEPLQVGY